MVLEGIGLARGRGGGHRRRGRRARGPRVVYMPAPETVIVDRYDDDDDDDEARIEGLGDASTLAGIAIPVALIVAVFWLTGGR